MEKNSIFDNKLHDSRKLLWERKRTDLLRFCRENPDQAGDVALQLIRIHKSLFSERHPNPNDVESQ